MAKTTSTTPGGNAPSTPVGENPAVEQVTLDEFCLRLSTSVRRPELINGFYYVEKKSGCIKDHESSFRARFDAFVNKPV